MAAAGAPVGGRRRGRANELPPHGSAAVMATGALKQHLQDLQRGRPGHRFQDHYEHEKHGAGGRGSSGRVWRLALGIAAVVIGVVLCVIPGPGLPFIFIGGGLLAAESRVAARVMDWLELRVRAVWRWAPGVRRCTRRAEPPPVTVTKRDRTSAEGSQYPGLLQLTRLAVTCKHSKPCPLQAPARLSQRTARATAGRTGTRAGA